MVPDSDHTFDIRLETEARQVGTPLHSVLDWQRVGAKAMFRHYLKSGSYLASTIEHCRSVLGTFVTLEMLFFSPSDK